MAGGAVNYKLKFFLTKWEGGVLLSIKWEWLTYVPCKSKEGLYGLQRFQLAGEIWSMVRVPEVQKIHRGASSNKL